MARRVIRIDTWSVPLVYPLEIPLGAALPEDAPVHFLEFPPPQTSAMAHKCFLATHCVGQIADVIVIKAASQDGGGGDDDGGHDGRGGGGEDDGGLDGRGGGGDDDGGHNGRGGGGDNRGSGADNSGGRGYSGCGYSGGGASSSGGGYIGGYMCGGVGCSGGGRGISGSDDHRRNACSSGMAAEYSVTDVYIPSTSPQR